MSEYDATATEAKTEDYKKQQETLLPILKEYFEEAKDAREDRADKWKEQYEYYINNHMPPDRPKFKSDIRINYAWIVVEVKCPVLTQNAPTVNFISFDKSPESEQRADTFTKLVGNALWNKLDVQSTLEDVIKSSQIYDAGVWKVGWDPSANQGVGEVFVSSIDPFKFFPDPMALSLDSARYVLHIEAKPLSYLKRKYPEHKDQIKEDKSISEILYEGRLLGDRDPRHGVVYDMTKFKVKRAYLKEYWLAPSECDQTIMVPVETTDPLQPQQQTPKYKNGRIITTVNDECIVDDKPNPYKHGKFPFVIQKINKLPNEFWGMGDIEQIRPIQDALNHAWQQVDDIANLTANAGWLVDPSLGEENIKKLRGALGKPGFMAVVPLDKVRAVESPQIPQYLIVRIRDLVTQIGTVSGITEIMQGLPVHHRTARGIERIFEAASNRIASSVRLMESALRQVAILMGEVSQQFYTEERTYALIGTSGIATDTLTFNPQDLAGEFEVSIDSGASLPKDKQSRVDLVMSLLTNHIFDMALGSLGQMSPDVQRQVAKIVLDSVEFPGREALLKTQLPQPMLGPGGPPSGPQPPGLAGAPVPQAPVSLPPVGPSSAPVPPELQALMTQLGASSSQEMLQMLFQGQQ